MAFLVGALARLLVPLLVTIASAFQAFAPEAYMDEPFHVPQTQQYCKGQLWPWDPKITTLPGLYVLGAAHAKTVHFLLALTGRQQSLYKTLHPAVSADFSWLMALLMVLFPLHFFFHFLYYTDVGSLTFVLSAYLACLKDRYKMSAVLAAWAVLFRQTNAVWVCFIIAASVLKRCSPSASHEAGIKQLPKQLLGAATAAWRMRWQLLMDMWPLLLVPLAFVVFVVQNGGIVLGDKAAHAPVRHLVQPLYFCLFASLALAPFHFAPSRLRSSLQLLANSMQQQPLSTAAVLGTVGTLLTVGVSKYSLVHPYLLADNRHYTFYLWKDLFARFPAARFLLEPVYMYCMWTMWQSLTKRQSVSWVLLFALCTAATILPAWLIEFRYFTTPFAMLVLHMQPLSAIQLRMTLAAYAVANAVTIYMYLCRPFRWPDGSIARFIW